MDTPNTLPLSSLPSAPQVTVAEFIVHWTTLTASHTAALMSDGLDHYGKRRDRFVELGTIRPAYGTPLGVCEVTITCRDHRIDAGWPPVWDQCTVDGRMVGNRCGALKALAERIGQELATVLERHAAGLDPWTGK